MLPDRIESMDLAKREKKILQNHLEEKDQDYTLINPTNTLNIKKNLLKALILALVCTVIVSLNIYVIGIIISLFILAKGIVFALFGSQIALGTARMKYTLSPYKYDTLKQSVSEISHKMGVREPDIYPFSCESIHAAVVHSYIGKPVMLVSKDLAESNEFTMRGVIGHEIGHIKNRSGRLMVYQSILQAIPILVLLFIYPTNSTIGSIFLFPISFGLYILIRGIICWIHRQEEFKADRRSLRVTNPIDMSCSLIRASPQNPFNTEQSESFKYTNLFSKHPPTDERIFRLLEKRENRDLKEKDTMDSLDEIRF